MKKVIKVIFSLGLLLSANVYAEMVNPFKLQSGSQDIMGYSLAVYTFHVMENKVVVTDVILNRGRCKIPETWKLPASLNYGAAIKVGDFECGGDSLLEVEIKTAEHGSWTWK